MSTRVLQIPELLSTIFRYASRRSNAACTIVCKQWLDPALNELWRHVNDLSVLFRLLAPMHIIQSDNSPRWLFSRFVLPSDWSRFKFYAHRIRSLHVSGKYSPDTNTDAPSNTEIDASVYAEVARTRPTLVILPKLRKLVWEATLLNQAILFMSSSLMDVEANIEGPFLAGEGFLEARTFLIYVTARVPHLVSLDLKASFSVRHVEEALFNLLQNSTQLEKLILPRYWLTSAVISQSACLPCLKVAQWEYMNQGEGDPNDVKDFKISILPGAFPALIDLSLEVSLHAATELIDNPDFPDRLTALFVDSIHLPSISDVQRFFASCSQKCQSLTVLHLDLHCIASADDSEQSQVTLETLEPILACTNIVNFTLLHNDPLAITDSDANIIASSWPSVVEIYLNHDPITLSIPPLTLAALPHFAEHCPHLEKLALYINGTSPVDSMTNPPQFAKLRSLIVGTSPIKAVDIIAPFMGRICPPSHPGSPTAIAKPIEVITTYSWDEDLRATLQDQVLLEIYRRSQLWHKLNNYLPMLLAVQAEERSRTKQLEQELTRLRSELHRQDSQTSTPRD